MKEAKDIEKYLSVLRHDLRNQLLIAREGVAQVLEGLGNKDCNKCFGILELALESTYKMDKLIEELLSVSKSKLLLENKQDDNLKLSQPEKEDVEKLKNELITMISHTVRTPLTIIKEGLSLILDEIPGKLNSKQKTFLIDIKNNVDRLVQSVQEILSNPVDKVIRPVLKRRKILLVEDEPDIVNMVKVRLEANNYEVVSADNGENALEEAAKEKPDLIILDLMMPKMNGFETAKRLKSDNATSNIPIIIFTAAVSPDLNQKACEIQAVDYITKPFEPKVLLEKIRKVLGG